MHRFVLTKNNRHVVSVLDNGNIAFYHLIDALNPRGVPPTVRKVETGDETEGATDNKENKPLGEKTVDRVKPLGEFSISAD